MPDKDRRACCVRLACPYRQAHLQVTSKVTSTNRLLLASNVGERGRGASWARLDREFAPLLDLSKQQGLGFWVHGDGRGEVLNVRLESPVTFPLGRLPDRYVTIDYTGWRYFELVESESSRWSDYVWNDGKSPVMPIAERSISRRSRR